MASELDVAHGGIRPPSPFPDAVVQHLRLEDPASLRKYLVKLHCLLNMTVPINQLPTELFAEILRFVRLQHPRHWSFVTVLLVCHHWYDIAVSLPMLWSDVTIAMPLHILEMYLTRSGDVSLSIAMQGQRTPASASPASLLNALSPHSHRVAQLDTCSSYPWIEHRMERISSLTIDDCDDMLWTFFASIPPPNGAISIHGDRFPNLESLTLCEVRVPASIASLRSLTSLKLDYVPYASWNALLDALGSCPALECLVLDSPIAPFESIVPPIHAGQNIVELRHLRRLDLSNFDLDDVDFEYPSLSFLLAHLSLPRTVRIDISTDFGEYDEQDSNELSTLLAGIIPADKTALPVFSALQGVQVTIGSQHLELVASGRDEAQTSGADC
ncbi:uncharacterized protein C8Q71DRAFT_109382 [Rhodofomes roseus]|uniref:F-box domain-containing protein n=1 Tax=Rhodofomes roseus TaxID=34475 RepID=A0ABQ8KC94_9APHY|nr:uncharacterized protein C8Q71DRAFT_109382 [Rhodofomes roseus]KAH9835224.1 hypothetical protein C8Q71DRAFT_109382 [Rhodofomes roseus]